MAKPEAGAKKRRRQEDEAEEQDVLAQRLAAYGERFLDMFDDADRRPARAPQPPAADSDSGREGSSGASDSDADGGGSGGSDDEAVPAGQVVEHIFHSGGRPGSSAGARRGAGPAGGAGGMPGTPHQQLAAAEAERLRLERKRFMSSKAAVVTSGGQQPARGGARRPGSATPGGAAAAEADGISREEFLAMQREVQLYGATALDKKSRRAFEAAELARLGAKAAARPRIPASIGVGMARKQAQRDERALQEGIAAGMIQQKGLGKKKRREKEKARKADRGLMEDGGAFRPGILRVKAPPSGGGVKPGGGGFKSGKGGGGGKGGGKGGRRRPS